MKFDDLVKLVDVAKNQFLGVCRFDSGAPPKIDNNLKREIVGAALYEYAVAHGQIVMPEFVIGISPMSNVGSGLRSTDSVKFRRLLAKLMETSLGDLESIVDEKWVAAKGAAGFIQQDNATDVEKFSTTKFGGFT